MKKPLKIYLCDLTYDTIILVSDTIPINIGFIGSYLNKQLGNKVSVELFKYPNDLLESIKKDPPDILGLSNYSWNSNLSEYFAEIGKKIKKGDTIMIVEAMKTMNHVPCPVDGVIKEICVEDGQPVEFGQTIAILD